MKLKEYQIHNFKTVTFESEQVISEFMIVNGGDITLEAQVCNTC